MHYQLLGETITFGYPFEYSHRWQIAVAGILTNLSGMQLHMRIVLGIIIWNIFLFDFRRTELVWFCYSLLYFSNNLSIYISLPRRQPESNSNKLWSKWADRWQGCEFSNTKISQELSKHVTCVPNFWFQ